MHGSWVRLLTIPLANDAMQKNTNDNTPLLSFFHPFFFKPHSRTASRFCTSPLRVPSPHLPVAVLHQTLDKATSLHGEVLIVCQSIKIKTKEKHAGECKEKSHVVCETLAADEDIPSASFDGLPEKDVFGYSGGRETAVILRVYR